MHSAGSPWAGSNRSIKGAAAFTVTYALALCLHLGVLCARHLPGAELGLQSIAAEHRCPRARAKLCEARLAVQSEKLQS